MEIAIQFANWINKNDYEKIHGNRWCKKFMSYTHSTEELFELFKQSDGKKDIETTIPHLPLGDVSVCTKNDEQEINDEIMKQHGKYYPKKNDITF